MGTKPLVITQSLLSKYQALMEFDRKRKTLREEIITLLERGYAIEPGPLSAQLTISQARPFTVAALKVILGPAEMKRLQDRIVPVERIRLLVKPLK